MYVHTQCEQWLQSSPYMYMRLSLVHQSMDPVTTNPAHAGVGWPATSKVVRGASHDHGVLL